MSDRKTLGERIRSARKSASMNMRTLAAKVGVSHNAIAKYERGEMTPSSGTLLKLGKALNVSVSWFFREQKVSIEKVAYRKKSGLGVKQSRSIEARVRDWIERYLAIEELTGDIALFDHSLLHNWSCRTEEEIEDAAFCLRKKWELGLGPIEHLASLLEAHGVKVAELDVPKGFDGLTAWVNGTFPVIVCTKDGPGDRQRLTLAHELGHVVLGTQDDKKAYRFAGAFLLPAGVVRRELGDQRVSLSPNELGLLKHKYGVSMAAWVHRARDLKIISERFYRRFFQVSKQHGWYKTEPGVPLVREQPERMKRLVMRALAEDCVTASRASELLGRPLRNVEEEDGLPAKVCR